MITVHLQGGCGNQLFQFAMGLSQTDPFNRKLRLDVSSFRTDRMREYSLDLFPRIAEERKNHEIGTADIAVPVTVHENGLPYNPPLVDSIKTGDVLKGYWQTEKYFRNVEPLVRWYLQPAPLTVAQRTWFYRILDAKNPTFLTVRRTDYVGNSFHGELPQEYYWEALKIIAEKSGQPTIFVFTDDTEWCQEHLNLPWPFFIAGTYDRTVKGHLGREDADLFLMACCDSGVMANSSFSWWGAYLGDVGRKGTVVAPKQWFGPTSNEDSRDIIPDRWIKI